MRVLIYGAGVLGSYLAHRLHRSSIEVTLLARGDWKQRLERNGLTIRHYVQLKTTCDKIRIIDELLPEDRYDVIFVVMQHTQIPGVLPALSKNDSTNIVFVGNNANARKTQDQLIENSAKPKQVWFGFQSSGGRRENGKVICIRTGRQMTLGSLDESGVEGTVPWQILMQAGYRIRHFKNMDAWLKCHLAFILPIAYTCYICGGDLHKADRALINRIIDAVDEGYQALSALGIPILPEGDETYVKEKRHSFYAILYIMCKTPIGRLAAGDHAMAAVGEMKALDEAFAGLCHTTAAMPNWNSLRKDSGIESMEA